MVSIGIVENVKILDGTYPPKDPTNCVSCPITENVHISDKLTKKRCRQVIEPRDGAYPLVAYEVVQLKR